MRDALCGGFRTTRTDANKMRKDFLNSGMNINYVIVLVLVLSFNKTFIEKTLILFY